MPTYRVTDPNSGKTVKLTGDSPPSEAELEEIFASMGGSQQEQPAPQEAIAPDPEAERVARLDKAVSASEAMFPRASRAMAESKSWSEALFPRRARTDAEGVGIGRGLAARAADVGANVFGVPYAAIETLVGPEEKRSTLLGGRGSLKENLLDREGSFVKGMANDPAAPAALINPTGAGLRQMTTAALKQGVASAGAHQAESFAETGEASLSDATKEAAITSSMPAGLKALGKGAFYGNKALGKLAQGLSGASEDALRTYGWGFGKGAKKLSEASGKQGEIGRQISSALDNLDDFLPEKDVVNRAIKEMPPVNAKKVLASLSSGKVDDDIAFGAAKSANTKIDDLIETIQKNMDETGSIPAEKFRKIRIRMDREIGDAFGKEGGDYINALKAARHRAAEDLVETAKTTGNPEYVEAMRSMADKLQKAEKLSQFLGKSSQTREARSEAFVSTLFGKNKGERQRAVKEMGEIFGQDFLEQSRLAGLAAELGEDGVAGLLPRQFTGRAALGPGLAAMSGTYVNPLSAAVPLVLSSPRLASGVLSTSGIAEQALMNRGLQDAASMTGRALARPAFRNNQNQEAPQ